MARRLGTLHDAEAARDLFQSKTKDPLVDALDFVGRHLDEVARQSGREITASSLATRIGIAALSGALVMGTVAGAGAPCLACWSVSSHGSL